MKKTTLFISGAIIMCLIIALSSGYASASDNNQRPILKGTDKHEKTPYVDGEILVKFKQERVDLKQNKGLYKIDYLETKNSVTRDPAKDIKSDNIVLFKSTKNHNTQQLMAKFADDPRVEYVQPNYLYYPMAQTVPWGVGDSSGVKAQAANSNGYTGSGVIVAVIDTGVFYSHTDLDANIWSPAGSSCYIDGVWTVGGCPNGGYDFGDGDAVPDDQDAGGGHGTHVAGTIAAEDNGNGVVGVAPDATIMPINGINPVSGTGTSNSIVRSVNFARQNGADIINMSLGHYHPSSLGNADNALREAISNSTSAGVLSVAASGNDSLSIFGYPAGFEDVISAGAIQQTATSNNPQENLGTRLAYFSNYGRVDVVAPGVNVNSTTSDGSYSGATWSGTSMASPHVAGVAALIKEKYPTATPAQIKQILQSTATDMGQTNRDMYFGSGLVNADAATSALGNSVVIEANYTQDNGTDSPNYYLPRVPADGVSTTKIRVTVSNSSGNLVPNTTVNFSSSMGTLNASSATTDSNGQTTVILTASEIAGQATVTASTASYGSASLYVDFTKLLLVSSSGEPYRYQTSNNISWFFTKTLEDLGYPHVRYETYHRDSDDWSLWSDVVDNVPSADYMSKFDLVIWYAGDWPTYEASQSVIKEYLDNGGNLIITGQDIGYYTKSGGAVTADNIYTNYLNAAYVSDGSAANNLVYGTDILSGSTLSLVSRYTGYSYYFGTTLGSPGNLWPDHITPGSGAEAIAGYTLGGSDAGLKYYNDTFRLIYLPFSFDSIYYGTQRQTVMTALRQSINPLRSISTAKVKADTYNDANEINIDNRDSAKIKLVFDDTPIHGYAYVKLSDGTNEVEAYKQVDTSDNTTIVSGINATSLNNGTIYVYAAHVYDVSNTGTLTQGTNATKVGTPGAPSTLRVPKKYRKVRIVRLKWNSIPSADYYKLQLRTKKGKKIKTFKTITRTRKNLRKKYTKSNKPYKFKVKACTSSGKCSSYSVYKNFRTKPARVKNVRLDSYVGGSFTAKWDAVRGKGITYKIKLMKSNGKKIKIYKTKKLRKTIMYLTPGKTYKYKVRAKYNKYNRGRWSKEKSVTLYPSGL